MSDLEGLGMSVVFVRVCVCGGFPHLCLCLCSCRPCEVPGAVRAFSGAGGWSAIGNHYQRLRAGTDDGACGLVCCRGVAVLG